MEEKMRILNLLKDGKITAEEAARLLDAVDQKSEEKAEREHHIRFKKHFIPGIEVLPETITKAMATAMSKLQENIAKLKEQEKKMKENIIMVTECEDKKYPAKSNVTVHTVSGDVEIEGGSYSEISLDCGGMRKDEERDDELVCSSVSEAIGLTTPEKINLSISTVSGDIDITNITGTIDCESVSGDLQLDNIIGKIIFKSASGDIEAHEFKGSVETKGASSDIEIDYLELDDSNIDTKSGDISITLPKKTDAIIEMYSDKGDIIIDDLHNFEELDKKEGYLKIGLGKQTKTVLLKTKSGDIEVNSE
jgi:DUF4097 and DUF4098 domain-containing protein YvlB